MLEQIRNTMLACVDRWYVGQAGAPISFTAACPESNPYLAAARRRAMAAQHPSAPTPDHPAMTERRAA
jgi:hypothetical protein